jgi:hypothetical protein
MPVKMPEKMPHNVFQNARKYDHENAPSCFVKCPLKTPVKCSTIFSKMLAKTPLEILFENVAKMATKHP